MAIRTLNLLLHDFYACLIDLLKWWKLQKHGEASSQRTSHSMAAHYLHNAIFTPDPSEISRSSSIFPHSRNVSTATATTLHANASEQSHTREPLLHSTTSESWAYADPFSRQATLFNEPGRLEWGTHPPFLGDPPTLRETKIFWEKKIRKRMRRLRYLMRLLEVIFGAGKACKHIAVRLN